tara:strand:- start:1719 stop:3170 length:1452 start_codon:yes stop_codon:yes gene_type:complete
MSVVGMGAEYPDKTIKIVVHTKPGGAIDIMARQVAQIAMSYTDESVVVVNKSGGSGLIAMANTYYSKPDGYTVLAFPAAFLAPIQTTDIGFGLENFQYLACMTVSPEAIITSKNSDLATFEDILSAAKAEPGKQKWCGPGSGSLDHLMAVKIWDKAGMEAKWIPYGGGGPAITAVMGNHSDVYVGNPEDILGREENLRIAAVANPTRLDSFPFAPTFTEFGIDLTDDVMWRGFAVKKGTDPKAVSYLVDLLHKVSKDERWGKFVRTMRLQSVFLEDEEFTQVVNRDAESSKTYLRKAGFKIGSVPESAPLPGILFAGAVMFLLLPGSFVLRRKGKKLSQVAVISLIGIALAIVFFFESTYFPPPREGTVVGAATVPQVWALLLTILGLLVFRSVSVGKDAEPNREGHSVRSVIRITLLAALYTILIPLAGFFTATMIMLVGGMLVMGYRQYAKLILIAAAVLVFMYIVFLKTLVVPLPEGVLL